MQIDETTYQINEINRYKTRIAKTQIVLAASLRKDSYHITRLLHKDFGKTKKWNTFTVSRNGTIYQHYNSDFHTDFLGIKNADKQSISIVLENMGCLYEALQNRYVNWINEECDENNVVEKTWFGYNYWEKIPDEQTKSVAQLCKKLCEQYNIPKICVDFNYYHKDILKFRGIVFRSNYIEDSSDVNPLFDIEKFNKLLQSK